MHRFKFCAYLDEIAIISGGDFDFVILVRVFRHGKAPPLSLILVRSLGETKPRVLASFYKPTLHSQRLTAVPGKSSTGYCDDLMLPAIMNNIIETNPIPIKDMDPIPGQAVCRKRIPLFGQPMLSCAGISALTRGCLVLEQYTLPFNPIQARHREL